MIGLCANRFYGKCSNASSLLPFHEITKEKSLKSSVQHSLDAVAGYFVDYSADVGFAAVAVLFASLQPNLQPLLSLVPSDWPSANHRIVDLNDHCLLEMILLKKTP